MSRAVLTLNAGSSSLKFALFELREDSEGVELLARGQVEGIGVSPHLVARGPDGAVLKEQRWPNGARLAHEVFLQDLLGWVDEHLDGHALAAVGHRVVHGGARFSAPICVDEAALAQLEALSPLAPLHQPHNLAAIRAATRVRPTLPQVACFDTAFHATQPLVATRFALTRALEAKGVRRYGFHGLSYEYIARRLRELDPAMAHGRVVAAHLGNGASLCAMKAGMSVETSMGFSTLDGLVMGTRCGALDAGVVLYLLQAERCTPDAVEELLYHRAGLLGVSGLSSDMRTLLASAEPHAREAVELFCYRVARETAALANALGGLDGFVFTAGIGENAAAVRAEVCTRLAWLGVEIEPAANSARTPAVISKPGSRVTVRVAATDEERMIALHTREMLETPQAAAVTPP